MVQENSLFRFHYEDFEILSAPGLSHCSPVAPYRSIIGPANGLLADGTKSLRESSLISHQ